MGQQPQTTRHGRTAAKPLIGRNGFREYDARWWFGIPGSPRPPELDLAGAEILGLALGSMILDRTGKRRIVIGHDYRSYSQSVKQALARGLSNAGMQVLDIGLALSPTAYFARLALDAPAVAMVTASHNENGWTGVKMGDEPPFTFGAEAMAELSGRVAGGHWRERNGGAIETVEGFADRYVADLVSRPKFRRPIRAVIACGNGTAAFFAPKVFATLGIEVVELDCVPDFTFPNHNPNPEDLAMLEAMADKVRESGADIALGFDGDGDRCGVVDNEGRPILADRIGLHLARSIARHQPGAHFLADVKSTSLLAADPVLRETGATVGYMRSGHSHFKRAMAEEKAALGIEKSGHFYFGTPFGRGHDDGLLAAIAILGLLEDNPGLSMAELDRSLPETFQSPTLYADCPDETKHGVASRIAFRLQSMRSGHERFAGQPIVDVSTISGARVTLEDGSWGLIRASSNEPKLVFVAESPVSAARRDVVIAALRELTRAALQEQPEQA